MNKIKEESLVKSLEPNSIDEIIIYQINRQTFDHQKFFGSLEYNFKDLSLIVRLADACRKFEEICRLDEYNGLWETLSAKVMLELDDSKGVFNRNYSIQDMAQFDLFRGLYYYCLSAKVHNECKEDSLSERKLLDKARNFNSIHATQRYYEICYNEIADDSNPERIFRKMILDCRQMCKWYGSYAYMMMAEVYVQYANFMSHQDNRNDNEIEKILSSALKCCEYASLYLEASEASIRFASLNTGLGKSNSMGIDSPNAAYEAINRFLNDFRASCSADATDSTPHITQSKFSP